MPLLGVILSHCKNPRHSTKAPTIGLSASCVGSYCISAHLSAKQVGLKWDQRGSMGWITMKSQGSTTWKTSCFLPWSHIGLFKHSNWFFLLFLIHLGFFIVSFKAPNVMHSERSSPIVMHCVAPLLMTTHWKETNWTIFSTFDSIFSFHLSDFTVTLICFALTWQTIFFATGLFGVPKSADVVSLGIMLHLSKIIRLLFEEHLSCRHHLRAVSEQDDGNLCWSCFCHFGTFVSQVSQFLWQLNFVATTAEPHTTSQNKVAIEFSKENACSSNVALMLMTSFKNNNFVIFSLHLVQVMLFWFWSNCLLSFHSIYIKLARKCQSQKWSKKCSHFEVLNCSACSFLLVTVHAMFFLGCKQKKHHTFVAVHWSLVKSFYCDPCWWKEMCWHFHIQSVCLGNLIRWIWRVETRASMTQFSVV